MKNDYDYLVSSCEVYEPSHEFSYDVDQPVPFWSLSDAIYSLDDVIFNVDSCANLAAKDTFIDDAYSLYSIVDKLNKIKVELYDLNCCGNFKKKGD